MRYWTGFASGLSVLVLGLLGALAWFVIPSQTAMYAEFRTPSLPAVTDLVLSPAWHWGLPTAGALLLAVLNAIRFESEARRALCVAITAGLLLAALALTYWALSLPIQQLTDAIAPD